MEIKLNQVLVALQRICSKQEKCRADIVDYMLRKQIPEAFHQQVLAQLTAGRFIDEERYARAAAKDKFMLNRWGKMKIRHFLETKQISGEIIEKALDDLDESDYGKMIEEEMHDKISELSGEKPGVRVLKILRFAASRGYEEEMVRKICNISGTDDL